MIRLAALLLIVAGPSSAQYLPIDPIQESPFARFHENIPTEEDARVKDRRKTIQRTLIDLEKQIKALRAEDAELRQWQRDRQAELAPLMHQRTMELLDEFRRQRQSP